MAHGEAKITRFYGYVVDLKVRALSDSLVYYLTLVDLAGNEVAVRLRVLPKWLRLGAPISGELVRVVAGREVYTALREPSVYQGLRQPRVVRARKLHLEQAKGLDKWVIYGETPSGGPVSYPLLSNTVLEKAKKAVAHGEAYLYVADTPSGSVVVTLQSSNQHERYEKVEKFLKWMDENSR